VFVGAAVLRWFQMVFFCFKIDTINEIITSCSFDGCDKWYAVGLTSAV
jgi:hypothetical protein